MALHVVVTTRDGETYELASSAIEGATKPPWQEQTRWLETVDGSFVRADDIVRFKTDETEGSAESEAEAPDRSLVRLLRATAPDDAPPPTETAGDNEP